MKPRVPKPPIVFKLKTSAKFFKGVDPEEKVKDSLGNFFLRAGTELHKIFRRQASRRSDGIGGSDGAVDTTDMRQSIVILSQGYDHVIVGTNLRRARMLAEGTPDPNASLEWIRLWRKRKNVPRRAKQVWKKVRTEGPIANPFHKRTEKEFFAKWDELKGEAQFK